MSTQAAPAVARLEHIAQARRVLQGGVAGPPRVEPWIERSWRRCLDRGLRTGDKVGFDLVPAQALRRAEEAHHSLLEAALPVMAALARAVAGSRYFTLLTDAQGVVIASDGPIDTADRRATLITRVGVDLGEHAVGTTAISAALAERVPVWLHRGEHFFDDTSCYTCAGAPIAGPDGRCAGMLDVTGIDAVERPELRHLVAQSTRAIENALVRARPHALMLRLSWPGRLPGSDEDALIGLDGDGWVAGANPAAREMLAGLALGHTHLHPAPVHASELFALRWEALFDARRRGTAMEAPLWSGLTVQVQATDPAAGCRAAPAALPLKDLEDSLILRAVNEARGNVMEAARRLGISRATVYRRLRRRP